MQPQEGPPRKGLGLSRSAEIREAAARVFERKGFAAATLADIAEELGRPKGSIHYHIKSKQDLLHEILMANMLEIEGEIRKIAEYPLPAIDRLRLVLRAHALWVVNPNRAFSATASARDLGALPPELLEDVSNSRRRFRAIVRGLIEEAQADGAIAVENPTIATRTILSVIVQLPRWFSVEGSLSGEEMADALWHIMLHGLTGPASASMGR